MNHLFRKLLSLMTRLRLLFSSVRGHVNGFVFGVQIQNFGSLNSICSDGMRLTFSRFRFDGHRNQLVNHGCVERCIFFFAGDDNVLEIGPGCSICRSTFFLRGNHCRIQIGARTNIGGMTAVCQGKNNEIVIGEDCLFSSGIEIWASDTHTIFDETGTVCNHSRPIHVGRHVWLGKNVSVLKGSSIGEDTVVGLGAMVIGDLPSRVVAGGTPARILKTGISWDRKFVDFE